MDPRRSVAGKPYSLNEGETASPGRYRGNNLFHFRLLRMSADPSLGDNALSYNAVWEFYKLMHGLEGKYFGMQSRCNRLMLYLLWLKMLLRKVYRQNIYILIFRPRPLSGN